MKTESKQNVISQNKIVILLGVFFGLRCLAIFHQPPNSSYLSCKINAFIIKIKKLLLICKKILILSFEIKIGSIIGNSLYYNSLKDLLKLINRK